MKTARYGSINGQLVDPTKFIQLATAKYKENGIFPYCDSCHQIVHLYGVHSPNPQVVSRFDHANLPEGANLLDDCILANRNPNHSGLAPDGWDDERGEQIRAEFFKDENLALAYAACLALCRKGSLPAAKFISMLARADRKRIWAYVNIPLWAIPYVLLTLETFTGSTKNGATYDFHFIFQKPKGTNISALWNDSSGCQIVKVFSNTGQPVNAEDNPYSVSENALITKAGNTAWITPSFLQRLKA